jgi:hypothetical protein
VAEAKVVKMNGEHQDHRILQDGLKFADVLEDWGHKTNRFFCGGRIPEDLPVDQWTDPRLWRHAAKKLGVYDTLVVIDEGLKYLVEYIVVDKIGDQVSLVQRHEPLKLPPRKSNVLSKEIAGHYDVAVGVDGYRARKKADGAWVGPWQKREESAVRDIIEHSKRNQAK